MSDRTAHPAADLFPLMGADELASLAEDIKANGLRQPVVLDADGRVLDGRNRLRACEAAGVEPQFVTVEAEVDPVALVVSLNVKRRNMTASQRAVSAAEEAKISPRSVADSGATFEVSPAYVKFARALVERDRAGADAVKNGDQSLKDAYDALRAREGKVRGESAERTALRDQHPDLAEQVDGEVLALREALAEAERRAEAERKERYAATMNILDGLRLMEQPAEPHHVERAAALLDDALAAGRGEQITPERLRAAAAFASALADALDQDAGEAT